MYIYIYILYIYIFYIYIYILYIYIYISFGISVSLLMVSEVFCGNFFVILILILLTIKSPVASAAFRIALFETVLSASVVDYVA